MLFFSNINKQLLYFLKLLLISALFLISGNVFAVAITADLEVQKISGVGASPVSVLFENSSYTDPIPVCTYSIPSKTANPATVRIQNLTTTGMSIYLQGSDGAVTAGDIHCIIAEEGAYTTAVDGIEFEARRVVSDGTNGSGSGANWDKARMENVTASVTGSYANPVVIGQVITSDDPAFSTFWTSDCSTNGGQTAGRRRPPYSSQATLCVGKHKGKLGVIPTDPETLGYMVFEQQTATTAQVNNIHYTANLGADTVLGVTNSPPYTYNLPNTYNYEFGIATQNAEDGGDGSWAVLYGANPLATGDIDLAVDETDAPNRSHTNEQVAYVAFAISELTLEKTVITNNGGTAVDADFVLTYTGSSTNNGIEGSDAVTNAFVLPGTYSLTEANLAGYTASAWSCDGGSLVGSDITVAAGDDITCTITNDDEAASLTISKTIISDNGVVATLDDFNVAVNSVEVPWNSPTATTGGSEIVTTSAGTYTLSEIDFASYAEGTWSCIDDDTSNPVAVTNGGAFDGADVTVVLGQSVTCSITNDDIDPFIPSLTVVKTIVSDNGGTNNLDSFDVSVAGTEVPWSDPTSMLGGSQLITQVLGTYTLSENNSVGYNEGTWECRDQNGLNVAVTNSGAFGGADITLVDGQALICSITNDDEDTSFTVAKTITSDNGGTATLDDFDISINGTEIAWSTPSSTTGGSQQINTLAGTYALSEAAVAGYTNGNFSCIGAADTDVSDGNITVALGETVVCSITNTDDAPSLTVTKRIVSNNGGTATLADFNVSVNGTEVPWTTPTSTTSGSEEISTSAGTYLLSEDAFTGYTNGSFSCVGAADIDISDFNITVALGETVVCSVTNTDDAPSLTVTKTITSDNGGTATLDDFNVSVDGTEIVWTDATSTTGGSEEVSTTAGTYALSEDAFTGYTNGTFSCVGGADTDVSDGNITVALGETIVCSVTNTDDAPSLTIVKTITSDNGGTATLDDFNVSVDGTEIVWSDATSTTGGSEEVSTTAGTYALSEDAFTGYTNGTFSCVGGADTDVSDGNITVALGETIVCSVTNTDDAPSLTIVKTITSDNGGTATLDDFNVSVDGTEIVWSDATSTTGGSEEVSTTAGTYALSEDAFTGYTNGTFSCVGGADTDVSDGNITVALGETIVCSVTNTDDAPSLTVTKTITSDNGGTATLDDFNVSVDGTEIAWTDATSTTGGSEEVSTTAGTYALSEDAFTGYTNGSFSCVGGADTDVSDGNITVALGETVVCSVTNTDDAPSLTVTKTITSDNGGTATLDDFNVSVDGTEIVWTDATSTTGGSEEVSTTAGTYALSEDAFTGYTNGSFSCVGGADTDVSDGNITVALGETIVCSVTNTDDASSLTVTKTITSDNGGTATLDDFNVSVDGTEIVWTDATSTTGGSEEVSTTAGTYALSEDAFTGYTNGTFSCVGGADTDVSDGNITVALGETVVCSVTNTDDAPSLTVTKTITSDNGGTATLDDFNVSVDGTEIVWTDATSTTGGSEEVSTTAGTYALSEDAFTGYTNGTFSCVGGADTDVSDGNITVALGETVVCSVTNTDDAPSLTVTKTITSDNGGTATLDDFNVSVDGTEIVWTDATSTTGGSEEVSTTAGTYALSEDAFTGYTNGTFSCVGGADTDVSDGNITVALGETVVCSVTNTDDAPSLTVTKTITSDNGGTATLDDFNVSVDGTEIVWTDATSTTGGSEEVSTTAGTYALSEDAFTGYTNGTFSCVGGADTDVSDGNITVVLGETVVCSVTNTDDAPSLTVTKTITSDNGGTATLDDFNVSVDGTEIVWTDATSTTGGSEEVSTTAGTYALSEDAFTGYTNGTFSCVGGADTDVSDGNITVALGETIVCSVTNTDDAPSLTVTKTITSDNGGTATLDDFNVSVDGTEIVWTDATSTTGGSEEVSTTAGTYALSEDAFTGYTNGTFSCVGGADADVSDGNITVALGETIVCSVTNTDDAPSLTVTKTITSDNGGTATLDDFNVSVDGTEIVWTDATSTTGGSEEVSTTAGTYALSEDAFTGYTNGTFSCVGGADTDVSDGNITIELGETVVCSVINDDDVPSYTMTKTAGIPSVNLGSNATVTDEDDTIQYTFVFENTGTVDLVNLAVQDPLFGAGDVCIITSLAAGTTDNTSCILTHTLTQPNVDAGSVTNTATSTAFAPNGTTSISEDDTADDNSVTTPITQDPVLTIVKSVASLTNDADSSLDVTLGDALTYTVTATNDGNITLNNVIVSDPQLTPTNSSCISLAPGIDCVLTGTHEVTVPEATVGEVVNIAEVVSDEITTPVKSNEVTTPVIVEVNLTITKTVNNATPNIGDTITFTLEVENLGPGPALDVLVTDIVPAGFAYVVNSMTGIPAVGGITGNQSSPDSGTGLTWVITSLAKDASTTLTFDVVVKAP